MKKSEFIQVVEWNEDDGVFVGSLLPYIGACCHGKTQEEVYRQLAVIAEDVAESCEHGDFSLPAIPAEKEYSGKFLVRINPNLHKATAIRAMMERRSLNSYIEAALEQKCLALSAPVQKSKRRKKATA